ncbi:MAG TPA: hypothetical protein VKP65_16465 [Rhodothermales bacterium]|nr:hypothetical protein [Rhodothermales bacterium]
MNQKTVLTLGACAVAGVAVFQLKRLVESLRHKHLRFDFPIDEELFIGWGGGNPRRARRRA